jgi:hypothetical protein
MQKTQRGITEWNQDNSSRKFKSKGHSGVHVMCIAIGVWLIGTALLRKDGFRVPWGQKPLSLAKKRPGPVMN